MSNDATVRRDAKGLSIAGLVGRISLAVLFVFSGVTKILDFPAATGEMAGHHLPFPAAMAAGVIVVQLVGSALLVTQRYMRLGAAALAVFTLLATLIAHMPWSTGPSVLPIPQFIVAMMNLAMLGGFIAVATQPRQT